jgi:hypothetical protein
MIQKQGYSSAGALVMFGPLDVSRLRPGQDNVPQSRPCPRAKDFDDAARAVYAAQLAEEARLSLIAAHRLRAWGAEQGRANRLARAMENENRIESPPIAP